MAARAFLTAFCMLMAVTLFATADSDPGGTSYANLSADSYQALYQQNRKDLGDFSRAYSHKKLAQAGMSEKGIELLGATVGVALGGDIQIYRSKNNLLTVKIKEAVDTDRTLFIGFRIDW